MACVEFTVNGQKCSVNHQVPRETSLYSYLRYHLCLPGTKAMCHQGVCGACIVNVSARRHTSGEVETFSVNSCLVLAFSCHGWDITTVEAVGSRGEGYSDFQKRIAAFNGTQCGFCTPGWVMQMRSLLPKKLTMLELENSFGSNTCRCTGYRPILDTIKSFAVDSSPQLCQRVEDIEELAMCVRDKTKICDRKCSETISESDWSIVHDSNDGDGTIVVDFGDRMFFKVFQEDQIFQVFQKYGVDCYRLIDGNTGKAVLRDYSYPSVLIDISEVSTLKQYTFDQNLVLGANIALEDCLDIFKEIAATKEDFAYLEHFAKHLDLIAQVPVRNIGSLAGNIMLKHISPSYSSDLFLLFEAVGATVTIRDGRRQTECVSLPDFLKTDMKGKLITNFELPPQGANHIFRSYKIMPRSQNALAIVNAAFNIKMNLSTSTIIKATIVYGNISAQFIHATETEAYLKGKNVFNNKILQGAINMLSKDLVPEENPSAAAPEIRKKLAIGLFYKFILSISPNNLLTSKYKSGGTLISRPVSSGKQDFQTDPSLYPLNQPVQKLEAIIQSSGEAQFVNDIPPLPREVFGAFVLSTVFNGEVDVVDGKEALAIPNVIAVYSAKDIPGINSFTYPGFQLQTEDEEILAKNVKYHGQPVAIVVATTQELAISASYKVKVTYKNVKNIPPVLTINQAKLDETRVISGDTIEPKGRGTNVKKVVKGVFEIGAQYHYYMEPLTCVTIPIDKGLEVYDVTQWMDLTQAAVARSMKMLESDVHVKVRRLGGGFGGKISRNVQVACASALVAKTLNRPCRFILPLSTNLTIAGRRLPCQIEYEVGVDNDGKVQYLDATLTEDDGYTHNENILAYTIGGFPNCYNMDYVSLKTFAVTTDLPGNTFARAPGTLEGMACIEHIMEHIAFEVGKDPTDVRLANMRQDDNDLPSLIETLKAKAEYEKRLNEIKTFNKINRWMKKAIHINVMLFPVIFYGNYTAMVSIYRGDGSVTVTTGGIEMGQGVNTKAAQVCAYELGIPLDKVTVIPCYSFVAANNIFSGSSIVSECVCYSVIQACKMIKERLADLRNELNNPSWLQLITRAGDDQIDLTATYMMTDQDPTLQGYSAFTVTILEIQLDVLTGKFEIPRVDILEDVGLSANPNIDVGQVEGGYIQGLSYYTSEKFVYDTTTGRLLSNDALSYEVYLAKDIPVDFRVHLRYNSNNPKGVLGSKAVGEMGVCTSNGILYALMDCIRESRKESGYDTKKWLDIDVPLTTEAILKALEVKTSEFVLN